MSNFWLFFLYFPFITPYSWPPTAFGCVKRISALAFPPIPLYLKSPSPTTLNPQLIFPTYQIPARGSAPLSQGCLVLQVFSALSPRRTQGFTREAYFYPPHPLSSLTPLFSRSSLSHALSLTSCTLYLSVFDMLASLLCLSNKPSSRWTRGRKIGEACNNHSGLPVRMGIVMHTERL